MKTAATLVAFLKTTAANSFSNAPPQTVVSDDFLLHDSTADSHIDLAWFQNFKSKTIQNQIKIYRLIISNNDNILNTTNGVRQPHQSVTTVEKLWTCSVAPLVASLHLGR